MWEWFLPTIQDVDSTLLRVITFSEHLFLIKSYGFNGVFIWIIRRVLNYRSNMSWNTFPPSALVFTGDVEACLLKEVFDMSVSVSSYIRVIYALKLATDFIMETSRFPILREPPKWTFVVIHTAQNISGNRCLFFHSTLRMVNSIYLLKFCVKQWFVHRVLLQNICKKFEIDPIHSVEKSALLPWIFWAAYCIENHNIHIYTTRQIKIYCP